VPGRRFEVRWVLANLRGSSVGFGVFAVLAHGLTSPHDEIHPTGARVVAHMLGVIPAGAIIGFAQRAALAGWAQPAHWFIPVVAALMTVGFLVGAYGARPPSDFLLAYAVAGATLALALPWTREGGSR
jgi:hypothetical protein